MDILLSNWVLAGYNTQSPTLNLLYFFLFLLFFGARRIPQSINGMKLQEY